MRRGIKCACLTLAAVGVIAANAVHAADSKSAHLQAAAAAAGQDLKGILSICDPRTGRRAPTIVERIAARSRVQTVQQAGADDWGNT